MWVLIQTGPGQFEVLPLRESLKKYPGLKPLRDFPNRQMAEAEMSRRLKAGGRDASGATLDGHAFKAKIEAQETRETERRALNADETTAEADHSEHDGERRAPDAVAEDDNQTDERRRAADVDEVAREIRGGADQVRPPSQPEPTTGAAREVEEVFREASKNDALFSETKAMTGAGADSVNSAAPTPAASKSPLSVPESRTSVGGSRTAPVTGAVSRTAPSPQGDRSASPTPSSRVEPKPVYDSYSLAGTTHSRYALPDLRRGMPVQLVPDPMGRTRGVPHKHDKAISIQDLEGRHIGYVKKHEADALFDKLQSGQVQSARLQWSRPTEKGFTAGIAVAYTPETEVVVRSKSVPAVQRGPDPQTPRSAPVGGTPVVPEPVATVDANTASVPRTAPAPLPASTPQASPAPSPEPLRTAPAPYVSGAPTLDDARQAVSRRKGAEKLSPTQLERKSQEQHQRDMRQWSGQDPSFTASIQKKLDAGQPLNRFAPAGVTIPETYSHPIASVHPEAIDMRPSAPAPGAIPEISRTQAVPAAEPLVPNTQLPAPPSAPEANPSRTHPTPPVAPEPAAPLGGAPKAPETPQGNRRGRSVVDDRPSQAEQEAAWAEEYARDNQLRSDHQTRGLRQWESLVGGSVSRTGAVVEPPDYYETRGERSALIAEGRAEELAARQSEARARDLSSWVSTPASRTGNVVEPPSDYRHTGEWASEVYGGREAERAYWEAEVVADHEHNRRAWEQVVDRAVSRTGNVIEPPGHYQTQGELDALRAAHEYFEGSLKGVDDRTGRTIHKQEALEYHRWMNASPERTGPSHERLPLPEEHHNPAVAQWDTWLRRHQTAELRRGAGRGVNPLENFSRTVVGAMPFKGLVFNPVGQAFAGLFLQHMIAPDAVHNPSTTSRFQAAAEGTMWAAATAHPLVAGAVGRSQVNARDIAGMETTLLGMGASVAGAHLLGAVSERLAARAIGPNAGRLGGALGTITGWVLAGVAHNLGVFEMFREAAQRQISDARAPYQDGARADELQMESRTGDQLAATLEFEATFVDEDGDALEFDDDFEPGDFEELTDDYDEPLPYEVTSVSEPRAGF